MRIKDYMIAVGDSINGLQAEVQRFVVDGWEPHGNPVVDMAICAAPDGTLSNVKSLYAQAMVLHEQEHAELDRLMDMEVQVSQIVQELDSPCADELAMLTFAHEELTKALRGGRYER